MAESGFRPVDWRCIGNADGRNERLVLSDPPAQSRSLGLDCRRRARPIGWGHHAGGVARHVCRRAGRMIVQRPVDRPTRHAADVGYGTRFRA
jgi:hypothetical protein